MNPYLRNIGRAVLIIGIITLILGIVLGFTVGTIATPILIISSVLLNSAGITLLRDGKRK